MMKSLLIQHMQIFAGIENEVVYGSSRKNEPRPILSVDDPAGDNYHFYRGVDYDNAEMNILKPL